MFVKVVIFELFLILQVFKAKFQNENDCGTGINKYHSYTIRYILTTTKKSRKVDVNVIIPFYDGWEYNNPRPTSH